MERMNDRSLATVLLTSHLVQQDAKPLGAPEFWRMLERLPDPETLLGVPAASITTKTDLSPSQAERVATLLANATALSFEIESIQRRGIQVLTIFDDAFPQRLREELGNGCPPVLYVAGPPELLSTRGVGIVGSRDVDPQAARVAKEAATLLAENELTVISGAAKGIDQIAMASAFTAGGRVVGVLADSLDKKLQHADTRRAIADENVCLITPFKPSMGFTVANAMSRNKIIYGLAETTFVVQSDLEKGGTWAGASESFKRKPGSVRVWIGDGAGRGNQALVDRGATPLSETSGLLSSKPVPALIREAEQLGLGM